MASPSLIPHGALVARVAARITQLHREKVIYLDATDPILNETGRFRYVGAPRPVPVASPSHQGSMKPARTLLSEWSLGLKSVAFVIFTGFVGTKMLLGRESWNLGTRPRQPQPR